MRRAVLATALGLAVLVGGCSDGSEDPASSGTSSRPAAGGEPVIDGALDSPPLPIIEMGERTPGLLTTMRKAVASAYDALDRKAAARAGGDASSPTFAHPAAYQNTAEPMQVPGVHVPIRSHAVETTTSSEGTATVETTASIADQVVTMSVVGTAVPDPGRPGVGGETETTTRADLCQPADETAVTVKVKQVRRADGAELAVEAAGTFVQGSDGSVRVDGLEVVTTAVERGGEPHVDHVRVSATGWEPKSGLISDHATYTVVESGERSTAEGFANEIAYAGLLARDAMTAALKDARERTESGGYCVLLLASSDKSTLAPGDSAAIDVDVVDARTGEPVEGATVSGSGLGGEVSPPSVPAPGTMTFTATGKPDYWAFLEVRTARGGDDATVRFNTAGWRFEAVSYTATAPGPPAPIEVTTTWRGEVCGDPFTDTWHVRVTFSSPVASHTVALEDTAVPLGRAPGGTGARLLIDANPDPTAGGPAFRLWVDDENPATRPSHHRVEVMNLEPVKGACVSS